MRFFLPLLLSTLLVGCPKGGAETSGSTESSVPQADRVVDEVSDEELMALLDVLGYEPELLEAGSMTFELDLGRVLLLNERGRFLQLFYLTTGGVWSHDLLNTWNRSRYLARGYIDQDGDLVLQADLPMLGGITERQIATFVAVFNSALAVFVTEVVTMGMDAPQPEEPSEDDVFH